MNESDKLRILIAEDEESFLKVLTTVLESSNHFTVYSCESGDEAIGALKRSQFDVVILDHKMPGKTGLNVLQWLHEQKLDLPVIMLTGAGSENIAVEAMKLGAYDYIRKDQFDKEHFPIIVNGVYERFLFKKEKEHRELDAKERQRNLASLELLKNSITSFSQIASTTLTTIALLTDESERLLQPLVSPEGKEHFRRYFRKMREEYETLATASKSIVSLSRVMYENYEGMQRSHDPNEGRVSARNSTHQKTPREN
jgi:DNA-binding response OmpR family regulator